jgi:hypothetical protein
MTKFLDIGALFGAIAIEACGGAQQGAQEHLDRVFACIQVREARIERSRATAARAETACPDVCAAAVDALAQQTRLCRVAHDVGDADALSRCERAEETARGIAAQAMRRCDCAQRGER